MRKAVSSSGIRAEAEELMPVYAAEAYLVASCLPDKPLRLFDCEITLEGPVDWVPEPSVQVYLQVFPGSYTATVGIPPHVRYQTHHRARTVIADAADLDASEAIARKRFLRCVAALALVGNNPVAPAGLVGPMFAGEGSEDVEQPGNYRFVGGEVGMSMTTGVIPIQILSPEATHGALWIAKLGEEPEVAWLLETFAATDGRQLLEFAQHDRQQLVIDYCRILEKIGQLVAPHIKTNPDAGIEAIRAKLVTALSSRIGPQRAAGLIKQAFRDIGEAQGEGSHRQIRAAGDAFGLPPEDLEAASDAWQARSKRAGHAGDDELTPTELLHAKAAARIYLSGYLRWRAEREANASMPVPTEPPPLFTHRRRPSGIVR